MRKKKKKVLKKKKVIKKENLSLDDLFNESPDDSDLEYRKFLNENLITVIREFLHEHQDEITRRAQVRIKMLAEMAPDIPKHNLSIR